MNGGGIVATAKLGHAEREQVPFPTVTELHRRATQGQRRFDYRLVGGRQDAANLGGAIGRVRVVGALCEREDSMTRRGELLLLSEPRLEGGHLHGE